MSGCTFHDGDFINSMLKYLIFFKYSRDENAMNDNGCDLKEQVKK